MLRFFTFYSINFNDDLIFKNGVFLSFSFTNNKFHLRLEMSIPTRSEIYSFIVNENCELLGDGRWELYEIFRDVRKFLNVSLYDWHNTVRPVVIEVHRELCERQRVEDFCRSHKFAVGALAA